MENNDNCIMVIGGIGLSLKGLNLKISGFYES